MAISHLPAAPFTLEVRELQRRGEGLNIFVYAGANAWARAQRSRAPGYRLCLPTDKHWTEFDWSVVRGQGITLIHWGTDQQFGIGFSRHLVRCGAVLVALLDSAEVKFFKPAPATNERAAA